MEWRFDPEWGSSRLNLVCGDRASEIKQLEMRFNGHVGIVRVSYGFDSGWIAIDFLALSIRPFSIFAH